MITPINSDLICRLQWRLEAACVYSLGERDDAGGHLAHAELQQQHAAIAALVHEALVSFEALAPSRALQERVVARLRSR